MQVKGIKLFIIYIFSLLLGVLLNILIVFHNSKSFCISDEKSKRKNSTTKNSVKFFLNFFYILIKKIALNTLFSLEIINDVC